MAKFELKFIDDYDDGSYITIGSDLSEGLIFINGRDCHSVSDEGFERKADFSIWLDKSTAIKFAKTLRTEINKITEREVTNG